MKKPKMLFAVVIVSFLVATSCSSNQAINSSITQIVTNIITPTEPSVIIREDNSERDGITFEVIGIRRTHNEDDPSRHMVYLEILLQSTDIGWTGFDVKSTELIIDHETGMRQSVQAVSTECLIYDNETCNTEIFFDLPVDISNFTLYYVSDKQLNDKEPIEVDDPGQRRFIAQTDLQILGFEPSPAEITIAMPTVVTEESVKPTPVSSKTPIPAKTSVPSSGEPPESQFIPIIGNIWTGVQVYYGSGSNIAYGFEILGGSENCPALPSGRGVKVRYPDGAEEWKDRDYLILSGLFYILANDPAISGGEWFVYSLCQ